MFAEKSRGNMVGKIQRFKSFFRQLRLSAEIWVQPSSVGWWLGKRHHNKMIKQHCDKGFHLWMPITTEITRGKRTIKFSYIECIYCGKLFFANYKEKQKYLNLKKQEKREMEKWRR